MATDQKIVDYITDQIGLSQKVTSKKMFGEFGLYFDTKLFGLICDNKLFIKPTQSGRIFIKEVSEVSPYLGAKPSFLIDEKLDDREWLRELVKITVAELPEPKLKKSKPRKNA